MWRDATRTESLPSDLVGSFHTACTRHACAWLVRDDDSGIVIAMDEATSPDGATEYTHAYYIPRDYIISISRW